MSRIMRAIVFATALMAVVTGFAASANAVTWHNTGDTAFTATGGAFTYSSTGVGLTCTSSDVTGTTGPAPVIGALWSGITITETMTGCRLAGIVSDIHCDHRFTASAWSSSVTSGNLDVTCRQTQGGVVVCILEGVSPTSYTNPSGATPGRFTSNATSTWRSTNPSSGSCPLGNGDAVSLTARTINLTRATGGPAPNLGPVVTRTA